MPVLCTTYSILTLTTFVLVFSVTEAQQNREYGKPCNAAYQCWRSDPIDEFGLPVIVQDSRLSKRLDIGGSFRQGGKCRCKENICQFYFIRGKTFYPCEEF